MLANVTAVVLEIVNFVLRLNDDAAVGKIGVYISGIVVLILLYSGWKGGDLVFRHGDRSARPALTPNSGTSI